MFKKLFVLPLALAAAVSMAGPAVACGDNSACGEACKAEAQSAAPAPKKVEGTLVTTTYQVEGMHCAHCVSAVNSKLSAVPGVSKAEANLAKKNVTVVHAKGQADMGKLQAALPPQFKLAAAPAAAAGDACCEAEGEACKDEHQVSARPAAGHTEACSPDCKGECHKAAPGAKPAAPKAPAAKPAPKK